MAALGPETGRLASPLAPHGGGGGGGTPLRKGEQVYYVHADGGRRPGTVVTVHTDEVTPYYTVSVDGQERSTERQRLLSLTQAAAGVPPPGSTSTAGLAAEAPGWVAFGASLSVGGGGGSSGSGGGSGGGGGSGSIG